MTDITISYKVNEKMIAEKIKEYVEDYIHDTIYDELTCLKIDVDCLDSASFYRVVSATTKELCKLLTKEED